MAVSIAALAFSSQLFFFGWGVTCLPFVGANFLTLGRSLAGVCS